MRYEQIRETEQEGWLFVHKGHVYKVDLNRGRPTAPPLIIRWDLLKIIMPDSGLLSKKELFGYLKEALLVFGRNGVITQGDNRYQIEFTF